MLTRHTIKFMSAHRKAKVAPNPAYPNGIDVDSGKSPACLVVIPYPAECVGTWLIECKKCGVTVAITAAGRPDDPRSLMMPCKEKETLH
jgi:hypothetical protein